MKSHFKSVAYRSPDTAHEWRLLADFCEQNNYNTHDLRHNNKILLAIYTIAYEDVIWLFHKRIAPYHFEMVIAAKKNKPLPI